VNSTSANGYAMGHTKTEEERLLLQSAFLEPSTRRLFELAGIGPGMKVLDLGCGAGDVAMLAARLVGPYGRVVGLDLNPAIVETARHRARAVGYANVTFVEGDLAEIPLDGDFDAIVGRLILIYLPDPVGTLRQLMSHLKPGGIVAFQELNRLDPMKAYPTTALTEKVTGWIHQGLSLAVGDVCDDTHLHRILLDAGLSGLQILVDTPAGCSPAFLEECTTWGLRRSARFCRWSFGEDSRLKRR
jgi:2-polyprenyl-3-methyl-5-hydroxy-6-metoxy-1,4-benzoquinol methylase